jgi:hypothetical protein
MPGPSPIDNRLLTQARDKAEASVPEQYTRGYNQIVAAGLKAMFSEKTFPMMKEYLATIKGPQDIPNVIAHGIIKLLSLVFNASQGKLQIEASGPACIVLMTHALDYVEDVMKITITPDILAQSTQLVNQGLMHFLKQATKMSDEDFNQIMQGRGKELAAAKQTPTTPSSGQPAPALPAQGAV